MSKTIRQIADELGVSKQAVQKRLSREPLCTSVAPYISTIGGAKYIDVVGENLIKSAFYGSDVDKIDKELSIDKNNKNTLSIDQNSAHISIIIEALQTTIDTLQKQLDVKDEQISAKDEQIRGQQAQIEQLTVALEHQTATLESTAAALTAAQALHAADKKLLMENNEKHWWQRKKKNNTVTN